MGLDLFHQLVAGLFLWALLCLAAAVGGLYAKPGDYWRSFWFMTGMWAFVDGALAWSGLINKPGEPKDLAPLLLFNAGLDVVYMITAVILMTRKKPNLRGFGLAVLIQGAFLLVFDLYFWWRCTAILSAKA